MTKLFTYLLVCSAILFAGCKKEDDKPVVLPAGFIINGVTDITVKQDSTFLLPIAIEQVEGTQEPVTISVEGLPNKVTAEFSPESGTPDFGSIITFKADKWAAIGTSTVKIIAKGNTTGASKEYETKLKIERISDCKKYALGKYTTNVECPNIPSGTEAEVMIDQYSGRLMLSAMLSDYGGGPFTAAYFISINCDNNTFTIENSYIGNFMGTGTLTEDKITINYSYEKMAGEKVECKATLNRK